MIKVVKHGFFEPVQAADRSVCCLQLQPLTYLEKPNRRYKNSTPTKLYLKSELEVAAAARWGSVEQAEAERDKRSAARQKRAVEAAQQGMYAHIYGQMQVSVCADALVLPSFLPAVARSSGCTGQLPSRSKPWGRASLCEGMGTTGLPVAGKLIHASMWTICKA